MNFNMYHSLTEAVAKLFFLFNPHNNPTRVVVLYLLKRKSRLRKVKQLPKGDSDPALCEAEALTLNRRSSCQAVRELMG